MAAFASLDIHNGSSSLEIIGQWSCPICSSQSTTTDGMLCAKCQQKILQTIDDDNFATDDKILAWQCPRCTLLNTLNNEQCNACGRSKLVSEHNETVLVNSAVPAVQGSMSLTIRERRHKDESYAEHVFQHIVKFCKQNKSNFIDDQFVHSSRSIGSTSSFGNVSKWLRISDIAPLSDHDRKSDWTMFSSPQPSDIQQGALGNCWLVAAIALISERPRLLEHILLTKTVNKEGVYLVRICHNGLWQAIIVDDYFPCTKHKHLVFTQAKRRQLYVPLIEKACAKLLGSYANLTSGNILEGLQLLTGAPCDYIDLKPKDHTLDGDLVWAQLLSAYQSNLLIGTSTGGTGVSAEEYASVHIHGNHAFSLLAAHELSIKPFRFVLIRDPHSHSRYAEDSITGNILQQLRAFKPTDRSTGAFWISWPRFLRYFSSITISTYNSDHFDIRERGKFTRSSTDPVTSYRFHLPTASMISISLLYHRQNRTTHSFHTQAFVLCDADDLTPGEIGKRESILVGKRGGFIHWSGSLRAGYYVLIPFSTSFWQKDEKHRDFTVVIHSSVHLGLTMKKKPATFLADCLISATIKMCEKKKQEKEAMFYTTSSKLGLKIFVAENLSTSRNLSVDIDMTIAKNVRHSRYAHLPYKTHDCIPPRYRQVIFITEWADKRGESAQLNYSYSHKHESQKTDPRPSIDSSHNDLHSPRAF